MSEFVGPFPESDALALEQQTTQLLEERFEGWTPAEGDLLTWVNKAFSRLSSQLYDQATVLFSAAFQDFGEKVASVPPILASPASATSTWTMVDNAGYTIPSGTEVTIASSGSESVGFRTAEEVIIAPGATTAAISLTAIEPGSGGNDLTADPELVDALAYVASIELGGVTSGGVDEEDEDTYLNRLVEELQLRSLALILGRDFEIDARSVAGVGRAKCIEAYNAETSAEEALCVSVYPIGVDGKALSSGVKESLKARQQAKVLSGINVFVHDPAYTEIDVKAEIAVLAGFDPTNVIAAVEARLAEYLSPAVWGRPTTGDPSSNAGWENRTTVYLYELISEIDRVPGVDRVALVKLAKHGSTKEAKDVALTGKVPLTEPGTFEVTAI